MGGIILAEGAGGEDEPTRFINVDGDGAVYLYEMLIPPFLMT